MSEEYYEGKGCKCGAYYSGECCCDVDWTDPEIYKLREQLKQSQARVAELEREIGVLRIYGNKDCTAMADEALRRAGNE